VKSGDKPAAVQSVIFSAPKSWFNPLIDMSKPGDSSETRAICGLGQPSDKLPWGNTAIGSIHIH
jgi:hypothetical protein